MFHQTLPKTEVKPEYLHCTVNETKRIIKKKKKPNTSFLRTANRNQTYSKDSFRSSSLVITQINLMVLVQCNSTSFSQNKVDFLGFIQGAVLCNLARCFHQSLSFWKRTALASMLSRRWTILSR